MDILFEDNHLLIINKRPGELSQLDKTGDNSVLEKYKLYLKKKHNKKGNVFLGLVNRLDRPTSGVLILAKTSKALSRMNKMLVEKKILKKYLAIVEKKPIRKKNTLINFLKKNQKQNKSYIVDQNAKDSKKAILHYTTLKELDNYSLLEISLETGRHHQIRVQLSNIGCFIKGDLKYGSKRSNSDKSICLHANEISFIHPVSKNKIEIKANTPQNNIWKCL
ncbi:MAG: RNA pseudouridine synthase [Flavobacteriaceae bacterium]|nr:RNA pseudouridine synthase [Flavobacteriaceae bacterium]|tara:strand:- start:5001 stop:5663 length:663 start_codon:yes stop_codon:yes gene_type:complete